MKSDRNAVRGFAEWLRFSVFQLSLVLDSPDKQKKNP